MTRTEKILQIIADAIKAIDKGCFHYVELGEEAGNKATIARQNLYSILSENGYFLKSNGKIKKIKL